MTERFVFIYVAGDGLTKEGKSIIINAYPIKEDGSRYSPEFAAFLKEAHGLDTSHGESLGENILR